MADPSEHRMVFDLRGRRKNVVKVVYAILAILMGASLFLTVGPLSIGDLFSGGSSSSSNSLLVDQADSIEARVHKDPQNQDLLLSLVRARYGAGNSSITVDSSTGQQQITADATDQFDQAAQAWSQYLALHPKPPNPQVALLASNALFTLAQTSTSGSEAVQRLSDAAAAQAIVAKARPNVGTLSTYAYYSYFAGDLKAGDKAAKQAEAAAPKAQKKSLSKQLGQLRTQAQAFAKQQQAQQAAQQQNPGKPLQNPLGGLSNGGLGATAPTP